MRIARQRHTYKTKIYFTIVLKEKEVTVSELLGLKWEDGIILEFTGFRNILKTLERMEKRGYGYKVIVEDYLTGLPENVYNIVSARITNRKGRTIIEFGREPGFGWDGEVDVYGFNFPLTIIDEYHRRREHNDKIDFDDVVFEYFIE